MSTKSGEPHLPRARLLLLAALIVLLGWTNLTCRTAVLSPYDLRHILGDQPAGATVRGTLVATPRTSIHRNLKTGAEYETTTAQFDLTEIRLDGHDWQPAFGRIATITSGTFPGGVYAAQPVELSEVIAPARFPTAPGLFDYRAYLDEQGIYYQMRLKSIDDWHYSLPTIPPPLADRFQSWAKKSIALGLPEKDRALELEWALTLGDKSALTDDVSEPFMQAATFHIFAVDGLRIAIISGILFTLFRALSIPRAVCGLLTIPFILFYAALTGWPASAVRAIVMAFVIFGGWALKRPSDPLNSLFAAAILILTWEPRELFQAGFQLSFVVVLCIILILPFFEKLNQRFLQPDPLLPESLRPRWQRILESPARWLLGIFLVSFAAWLGSIPLAAYYFHLFTPSSGPANMFAVPLCGLVLICNLSSLLLVSWFPYLAVLFNHAGWALMQSIIATSQWSAHWRGAYWYVSLPGWLTIALYYFLLLAILTGWLFQNPRRKLKIAAAALLCAVWCAQGLWAFPETRLTVLPLDGGHAIYLQPPGWHNDLLVDCGSDFAVDATLKPYLRAQGVNRLPQFILTHGEDDYSGGAELLNDLFHPQTIATSAAHFRSIEYRAFQAVIQTNGATEALLHPGDHLGPFTVLYPGASTRLSHANDEALVLRADMGGTRVLLLSDLGHAGQNELLNELFLAGKTNDLHADIVVAGVPEKSEPLSEPLLNAVQPKLIIIADADHPAQRHATQTLKARLAAHNIPVIYTSTSGAVAFTFRSGHWQAEAMDGTTFRSSKP